MRISGACVRALMRIASPGLGYEPAHPPPSARRAAWRGTVGRMPAGRAPRRPRPTAAPVAWQAHAPGHALSTKDRTADSRVVSRRVTLAVGRCNEARPVSPACSALLGAAAAQRGRGQAHDTSALRARGRVHQAPGPQPARARGRRGLRVRAALRHPRPRPPALADCAALPQLRSCGAAELGATSAAATRGRDAGAPAAELSRPQVPKKKKD